MEYLVVTVILFYILSSVGYITFFLAQKEYLHKAGYYLLLAGCLFHVASIIHSFAISGSMPARNLYETLSVAGCATAGVFLILSYKFRLKSHGFFFKRLPSLDLLDSSGYLFLVTGFTMLTIGLIVGIVYAKSAWGRFWSWDIKEVWSAISWLVYAALLHQRLAFGWRGRRTAIMAIIGFAFLLFTFIGVNFLLQSHHGGFTRW